MPHKYRDAVTLVQKWPDGSITRVNATVLNSHVQSATSTVKLRNNSGVLPDGEFLDLVFPRELPEGHSPKSIHLGDLFKHAGLVPAYVDGANIGWEPTDGEKAVLHIKALRSEVAGLKAKLKKQE